MKHRLDWADCFVLLLLVNAVVGLFVFGWAVGNEAVARECKTNGSFHVGITVYECKPVGETK
jgi:hypothetical protein